MQPVRSEKPNRNRKNSMVWLTAALLTILVIATVAVAGNCLYSYAHQSDCQISLYDGRQIKETSAVLKSTWKRKKSSSDAVLRSHAESYRGSEAQAQARQGAFEVDDNAQVWKTETAIELFKTEYKNADGAVTVKSADGRKVIAPGTEGSYTFSLKNTRDTDAEYRVWVDAKFGSTATGVPIEIRMNSDNGWMLGDKNSWEQASALNGVTTEEKIDAGRAAEYTIYWQWPFEQNTDAADTGLSDASVTQDLSCTVTIYTMAMAAAGHDEQNRQKPVKRILEAVKTGDAAPLLWWAIALAVSAVVICYLCFIKRRKNDEENANNEYRQGSRTDRTGK